MTRPADRYLEFTPALQAKFEEWRQAKDAAERWKERLDEKRDELLEAMGEFNKGTIDGVHVVTKVPPGKQNRFQVAKFHDAMPDLYEDYCELIPVAGKLLLPRTK